MTEPRVVKTKFHTSFYQGLPRMEGKVVVVTGCTTGTGFVCARDCAKLGATVALLNRASDRADAALKAIQAEAPNSKVVAVACDLQNFASVREAAARLREEFGSTGVDVLCNNAGVMALADTATEDGFDVQMQTNHLSHFLLTCEIWGLLNKAAELRGEARVANHSSGMRIGKPLGSKYFGKNGGNLGGDAAGVVPGAGPRWERYHQTKLANLVFTYAMRDRCEKAGSKVKALVAHPGMAATNLQVTTVQGKGMSGSLANALPLQSCEDGAICILRCCCDPMANSGDFFGPKRGMAGPAKLLPAAPEEKLATEAARAMLWEESEKATGVKFDI